MEPWIITAHYCFHWCFSKPECTACFPLSKSYNSICITCQAWIFLKIFSPSKSYRNLFNTAYSARSQGNKTFKSSRHIAGKDINFISAILYTIAQVCVTSFLNYLLLQRSKLTQHSLAKRCITQHITCEYSQHWLWAISYNAVILFMHKISNPLYTIASYIM